MPIQVVATFKRIPPPPVTLLSVGPEQFIACQTVVTLTAVVDIPANIIGHTLEWEQLSGPAVVLNNTDQLVASYTHIAGGDKVFKFTLDEGYPEEQSGIVTIYDTPTSLSYAGWATQEPAKYVPSDAVPCDSIIATPTFSVPEPTLPPSDDVELIAILVITWDKPEDPDLDPFLTQMTLYENGSAVQLYDGQGSPATLVYEEGIRALYQILSEFNVRGYYSSEFSCVKDFTTLVEPNQRVIDDVAYNGFANAEFTKIIFTNEINSQQESLDLGFPVADAVTSRFINTYQDITDNTNTIFANPEVTTQRFDPGGIGG